MANFNKNIVVYDNSYTAVRARRATETARSSGETLADKLKTVGSKYSKDITAIQDFVDTFAEQSKVVMRNDNTLILKSSHKPFNRVDETKATKRAMEILNTNKFFNTVVNKGVPNNMPLKYHNMANINTTTSYENMTNVFGKYQSIIKSNGTIASYDLETLGSMAGGIWNPLGITEFGVNIQNVVNGKVVNTTTENIVLTGNVNHALELEKIKEVLESPGGLRKLRDDPQYQDLLVSAKRYSMYGHQDTKMHFDKAKGYAVVDSFVGEKGEAWGNIKQITAGVEKLMKAERAAAQSIDPTTGLRRDIKASVDYAFQLMQIGNQENGLIVGHNIRGFDNAALNQYIKRLYNSDKSAQKYIAQKMKAAGMSAPGFHLGAMSQADSLNFSRVVNNKNYMGALLDVSERGRRILAQAGRGVNKQEYIGEVFFPHLFEGAMAHSAGNDTAVANAFFTHRFTEDYLLNIGMDYASIAMFEGKTLIEVMNDMASSADYNPINIKANRQQVFMANKTMSGAFGGKKIFNFTQDSRGNIITNTGHFIDSNGSLMYNPVHGKQIGVVRNQPYTIVNYGAVDTSKFSQQLAGLAPEFANEQAYFLQVEQVIGKQYNARTKPANTTMIFPTKEEMEGFIDSYFTPFAETTKNGGYKYLGNRKISENYAKQYVLTKNGLTFNNDKWAGMTETEQIASALNANFARRYEKKAAENFLFGDKSVNRVAQTLDLLSYLESSGLSEMTADDLGRIYYGEFGMEIGDKVVKEGKAKDIAQTMRGIFGFKPRDDQGNTINKKILLDATADNVIASFEFVKEQEAYYRKTLNAALNAHGIDPSRYKNYRGILASNSKVMPAINNDFVALDKLLSAQVADRAADFLDEPEAQMRNYALNANRQFVPKAQVDNMYEFKLGKSFLFNKKASTINTSTNPKEFQDVIQYSLDNADPGMSFVDRLIRAQTGATRKLTEAERIEAGRQAFYEFVTKELPRDKDLMRSDSITELMNYVEEKDYNLRHALSFLEESIAEARKIDPNSGVIRVGAKQGLSTDFLVSKFKNNLDPEEIAQAMKSLGKTVNVVSKKTNTRQKAVNQLVNSFVVDEKTFLKDLRTLHGEDTNAIDDTMMLYHTIREQYATFFNNLIDVGGKIDADFVFHEDTGSLFAKRGEKIIELDNIPRIMSDSGALYAKSGNKMSDIYHVLEWDEKKGAFKYRTNLDDEFGGINKIGKIIDRQLENGVEVDLDTLKRDIGFLKTDFEKSAMYKYSHGSLITANSQIDIRGVEPLLPELFKADGKYHSIVSRMSAEDQFNVKNIGAIMERKIAEEIEPGELDPIQRGFIAPDLIPLLRAVNKTTANNPTVDRLLTHVNATNKETKVTKNILGVNALFINRGSGYVDNYGRPVTVSAFNTNWIRANTIEEASKTYEGLLIGSRVIDSREIHKNIYKNVREVGNLATDFSIRQLNISNQGVASLVQYKRNEAINAVIDKYAGDEKYGYIVDNVSKIMSEVQQIVKDSVFEQGKLMDPLVFEKLRGDVPQDIQNISFNLDALPVIEEMLEKEKVDKLVDTKLKSMYEMLGNLEKDSDGRYVFTKAPGTIIKRGETVFPYKTFGDIEKNLGGKFSEGVLSFKYRNAEGIELTESEITDIINDTFQGKDINIKDVANLFTTNKEQYASGYEIGHLSLQELPKTISNSAEKSMTRIPYVKAGSYDVRIRELLNDSGNSSWVDRIVLRDETLDAWYNDLVKKLDGPNKAEAYLREFGFDTIQELKEAARIERLINRDFMFGENGIFGKVSMVANDNVVGHENMGHIMASSLGEAIRLTGKYTAKPGFSDTEQWEAGIRKVADIISSNPKDFGFLKEVDKSEGIDYSKPMNISDNLTLLFSTNMYDKDGKKGVEVLDASKLVNLFREIDSTVLKNAPAEDRLVHTDLEGIDELVGAVKTITVDGKRHAIGSLGVTSTAFAVDSEVHSGVSQEYLDAKKDLMDYIKMYDYVKATPAEDRTSRDAVLLQILPKRMESLRREIDAMADSARFMKIDDQLRNILSRSALNITVEEQLSNIVKNSNDSYAMGKLIEEASGKLIARNNEGKFEINSRYKTDNVNRAWLDDVKQQIVYDSLNEKELTEEMLREEEYKHLKPIYDEVVGKRGMKLGVDSAELFHQGNIAYSAALFNAGGNIQMQNLVDKGVQIIPAEEYIGNLGKASAGEFVSSYAKDTVLLDLGENYASMSSTGKRYIAIPGLGTIANNEEVKKEWQKTAGSLASTWQRWADLGFSDTEEGMGYVNRIDELFDKLNTQSQNIIKKDSVFAEKAKVRFNAPAQRFKLLATLGDKDLSTPLLEKIRESTPNDFDVQENLFRERAQILGKSIAEWEKEGPNGSSLYFNYRMASEEDFRNKGYFNYDYMRKMGFTKKNDEGKMVPITNKVELEEEMRKYLSTHGTMDVIDRYPNIYDTSAFTSYAFLDRTLSENATAISGHSLAAEHGDSDGDSQSTIKIAKNEIDYALFNKHKQDSMAAMKAELKANGYDISKFETDTIEDNLRRNTIASMQKSTGVSEEKVTQAYDFFRAKELESIKVAVDNAKIVRENVAETLAKDSGRAHKAMSLSVNGNNLLAEVEGGRSSLGNLRVFNRRDHVQAKELFDSDMQLKDYFAEAVNIFDNQPELFKDEGFQYIEGMREIAAKDSTKTIATFNNKQREALDEMLYILQKSGSDMADEAETAALKRIQQNKYVESLLFKTSKNAIGLVDAQLYAMKQASENYFTQAARDTEDRLFRSGLSRDLIRESPELKNIEFKKNTISLFASGTEQDIISAKKIRMYAGDDRFMAYGELMQTLRNGRSSQENRQNFLSWFDKYGQFGTVASKFDEWVDNGTISESMVSKVETQINKYAKAGFEDATERGKAMYLAEQFYNTVDTLYKNNENFRSDSNLFSVFGRSSGAVNRIKDISNASGESHSSLIMSLLSGQDISYKEHDFERKGTKVMADRLKNINDFHKLTRAGGEALESILEGGSSSILSSPASALGFGAIGLALGVAVAGYAGGPVRKNKINEDEQVQRQQAEERMTVPEFFDNQGGFVTGNSQQGYVININANTKKGERHMKRAMKEAVAASVGGAVNINMNFKSNNTGGWSDKDIEKIINNYM